MANLPEIKAKIKAFVESLRSGRKNKTITLKEAYDFLKQAKEITEDVGREEADEELKGTVAVFFAQIIMVSSDWSWKWRKEKTHPTKEEFEMLKKKSESFQSNLEDLKEESPTIIDEMNYSILKADIKDIESFIEQEEKYQQNPSDPNNNDKNDKNDENDDEPNEEKDRPSYSNHSDLEEKIKDLQTQIKELEKKQQQNPNSNSKKEELKLSQMEKELERLKEQKKYKDKKKKPNNPHSQNSQNKGDFPYALVIGGGVVIVILLIIIFYLLGKSSEKKN